MCGEIGNPLNVAMVSVQNGLSPQETLQEFSNSLTSMLPLVSVSFQFITYFEIFLSIMHKYNLKFMDN